MGDETGEFSHETMYNSNKTEDDCPWSDVDGNRSCPDASKNIEKIAPPTAKERAAPSEELYCKTVNFFTGGWGKLMGIIVVTLGVWIFLTGKITGGLVMIAAGLVVTSIPALFISFMAGFGEWSNMTPGKFEKAAATTDVNFNACKDDWKKPKDLVTETTSGVRVVEDPDTGISYTKGSI